LHKANYHLTPETVSVKLVIPKPGKAGPGACFLQSGKIETGKGVHMAKTPDDYSRDKPVKKGRTDENDPDACRCKEVSKKSLSELLKLMAGDLAFWKKTKRN
jgi:hypothetical protein